MKAFKCEKSRENKAPNFPKKIEAYKGILILIQNQNNVFNKRIHIFKINEKMIFILTDKETIETDKNKTETSKVIKDTIETANMTTIVTVSEDNMSQKIVDIAENFTEEVINNLSKSFI